MSSSRSRRAGVWVALGLSVLLVLSPISASATVPSSRPAVIGGSAVTNADVPWQVLFIINGQQVCSGALVSPTQIVSAAHCFTGHPVSQVQAWTAITDLSARSTTSQLKLASITAHPSFDATTFANDIAVVRLAQAVPARLGAATIALPATQDAALWPAAGDTATVSGWGETASDSTAASDRLQAGVVDILAAPGASTCGEYGDSYLPSLQICAGKSDGSIDACQGDSGGPLTMVVDGRPVLAGISSTGLQCATAGYPGLYARATSFLPWLASQGVDVARPGSSTAATSSTGSANDGVLAHFMIGGTYGPADFATYSGISASKAKITLIQGKACKQVKGNIKVLAAGKCTVAMTRGKKSARLIVTVYPQ